MREGGRRTTTVWCGVGAGRVRRRRLRVRARPWLWVAVCLCVCGLRDSDASRIPRLVPQPHFLFSRRPVSPSPRAATPPPDCVSAHTPRVLVCAGESPRRPRDLPRARGHVVAVVADEASWPPASLPRRAARRPWSQLPLCNVWDHRLHVRGPRGGAGVLPGRAREPMEQSDDDRFPTCSSRAQRAPPGDPDPPEGSAPAGVPRL